MKKPHYTLLFMLLALSLFMLVTAALTGEQVEMNTPPPAGDMDEEEEVAVIRMLHVGDTMLDRGVEATIVQGINPFENAAGLIEGGAYDVVTANLEGPFTSVGPCQEKPYSFRFEPEYVELLVEAGITAVNLSNNHTLDCFERGTADTEELVTSKGIATFGGFGDEIQVHNERVGGTEISFLGFDTTLGIHTNEEIVHAVEEARKRADLVVVHMHWGYEYQTEPHASQQELAEALAASGADVVVGHHPHVLQPVEVIDETVVFYSLGNFVFDQLTQENRTGAALETVFEGEEVSVRVYPYLITNNQPTWLQGEEKVGVCERVLGNLNSEEKPCIILPSRSSD